MNLKHQQFINEYFDCWNATEAYQRVYPKATYDTARTNGATLLANTNISAVIKERIAENAMSADEVLKRLGEHARGSIGDFVTLVNGTPVIDFSAAQDKMHLVKKLKIKTRSYMIEGDSDDDDDSPATETTVEFELYDAQAALVHIGKHHKLFVERQELTGANGGPVETKSSVTIYLPDNARDQTAA